MHGRFFEKYFQVEVGVVYRAKLRFLGVRLGLWTETFFGLDKKYFDDNLPDTLYNVLDFCRSDGVKILPPSDRLPTMCLSCIIIKYLFIY